MLIELDAIELRRALRAVSLAMSADRKRANLNSVRIGVDAGDASRFSAVATDGHWLARWYFTEGAATAAKRAAPHFALVRGDDVKAILSMLGAKPVGQVRLWTKGLRVKYDRHTIALTPNADVHYPAYASIFPKLGPHDGFSAVGLSPALLAKVSKAFLLGHAGCLTPTMTFAFHEGALDPITVTSQEVANLSAIVMPCRVNVTSRVRKAQAAA